MTSVGKVSSPTLIVVPPTPDIMHRRAPSGGSSAASHTGPCRVAARGTAATPAQFSGQGGADVSPRPRRRSVSAAAQVSRRGGVSPPPTPPLMPPPPGVLERACVCTLAGCDKHVARPPPPTLMDSVYRRRYRRAARDSRRKRRAVALRREKRLSPDAKVATVGVCRTGGGSGASGSLWAVFRGVPAPGYKAASTARLFRQTAPMRLPEAPAV